MMPEVVKQEALQQMSFTSKCPVSLQQNYLNLVCPVVCVWERVSNSAGEKKWHNLRKVCSDTHWFAYGVLTFWHFDACSSKMWRRGATYTYEMHMFMNLDQLYMITCIKVHKLCVDVMSSFKELTLKKMITSSNDNFNFTIVY